MLSRSAIVICLMFALAPFAAAAPLGTDFTYQGHLKDAGNSYTGMADLLFSLWDAASSGSQIGSTVDLANHAVTDGRFTVSLDFGAGAFDGSARWLEIAVRVPAGSGGYVTLSPRQPMAATPYALHAAEYSGAIDDAQLSANVVKTTEDVHYTLLSELQLGTGLGFGGGAGRRFWFDDSTSNTDPTYIARENVGSNVTQLRVVISDDPGGDKFAVGFSSPSFGGWNSMFSVETNGDVKAAGTITASTTPDLAETIPADDDVEAGDVVRADPENRERAIRCRAGDPGMLGVISDGTSSFMINSYAGSPDAPLTGKPLVLAGRVPVKVSNENGPIRNGDWLTPSSTPGVAMRATEPGPVVGIALDSFGADGATRGMVLCLVQPGEANGAAAITELSRAMARKDAQIQSLEDRLGRLERMLEAERSETTAFRGVAGSATLPTADASSVTP